MTEAAARDEKLMTPRFLLAWVINFSQYLGFYILITTMAAYAAHQFGANEAMSGLAASSFVIGATLARVFSGFTVDTIGIKKSLYASVILVVVATALYSAAHSLGVLIAVRAIHGIGYAFASTCIMAVAQTIIPPKRRAEGTGYFALGTTAATAVGPGLGIMIADNWGDEGLPLAALIVSATSLALAFVLRVPASAADEGSERPKFSLSSLISPRVVPIASVMLLAGVTYSGIITFLNEFSADRGLSSQTAAWFFLAYALVMLISRFFLGRLQDRRGDNAVFYPGLVSFAAGLILLAVATSQWQVILAGVFVGGGYGTLMPAAQAISVRLVPAKKMGTGISTLFLLLDVGIGFGPILLGLIVSAAGYSAMYWALTGVIVLAAVLYLVVHGRKSVAQAGH